MDWANNVIVASLDPKEGFHCCDGSHRMHVCIYVPVVHECCPCLSSVDFFLFLILFVPFFCIFQHQAFRTSHPLYGNYNAVCNSGER